MLSGIIARPQIFVHKERLSTSRRTQQKHIIILDQAHLQSLFLNVEFLRHKSEPVAHLQHSIRYTFFTSVIYAYAQGRGQFHSHILSVCKPGLISRNGCPELAGSIKLVQHRSDTHLRDGSSHHIACPAGLIDRLAGQYVYMKLYRKHLLRSRVLKKLIDLICIHPVLCRPCRHRQHLSSLRIQAVMHILDRFPQDKCVHNMLAVKFLSYIVKKRQIDGRTVGTQRSHPSARSHLRRQLVQIGNQMTSHPFIADSHSRSGGSDVRQDIFTAIREIQIILENARSLFIPEYVLFGKPFQFQ